MMLLDRLVEMQFEDAVQDVDADAEVSKSCRF